MSDRTKGHWRVLTRRSAVVVLVAAGALLSSGCVPVLGRAFENSSADYNDGDMHEMRTPGEMETVADAVVSVMESSGATFVQRKASSSGSVLVLSFRVSVERVVSSRSRTSGSYSAPTRWFRAGTVSSSTVTTADYVAYGALFYVQLRSVGTDVLLQAIGLPVIDGVTACPQHAIPFRICQAARARGRVAFADDTQNRTGITVSGAKEAEVLTGLLGQLQRKRWQDAFRASVSAVKPATNDGVDDAFSQPSPPESEQSGGAR